jgi:hypothetical protein
MSHFEELVSLLAVVFSIISLFTFDLMKIVLVGGFVNVFGGFLDCGPKRN